MSVEPQFSAFPGAAQAANLTDIAVHRSPYARPQKDGDITAALAALPASPEILDSVVVAMPNAAAMRDVTPTAAAASNDIEDYWNRLRGGDAMPPRDGLKASEVAARWPNLVLFCCSRDMHPDSTFATALRAHRGNGANALTWTPETTALLSQWMLRGAHAVAADGAPARDRMHIDTVDGRTEYVMNMLPFAGDAGETPGYVLCNIEPLT